MVLDTEREAKAEASIPSVPTGHGENGVSGIRELEQ